MLDSYDATILTEATYVYDLGPNATEDKFHATYSGILSHWFPTTRGYVIDHQVMGAGGKPEYIVVRHAGTYRNPILIVELKRPSKWTEAGQQEVVDDLVTYIEGRFDITEYKSIYGLAGIGLRWMVCKMEKNGDGEPTTVQDWGDNVASKVSFAAFRDVAELLYNIK